MICDRKSFVLNTTYENTVFMSEWSIYGGGGGSKNYFFVICANPLRKL